MYKSQHTFTSIMIHFILFIYLQRSGVDIFFFEFCWLENKIYNHNGKVLFLYLKLYGFTINKKK